jgi:hypothetical protein
MVDVSKGDLTSKEKDKAAETLVTSGYTMLYYAAAPLSHAISFFHLILINCYTYVYNFQSLCLR